MNKVAQYLCELIPENGKVLTQCFGETIVGMMLRNLKESGKTVSFYTVQKLALIIKVFRLTATCCSEIGFEQLFLTDNMIA